MTAPEEDIEKKAEAAVEPAPDYEDVVATHAPIIEDVNPLKRNLGNRHMQMIAIGMSLTRDDAGMTDMAIYRRFHRCWSVRQYWECIADWRTCISCK